MLFHNNQPADRRRGPLSVFGSSNCTTPSANLQQEHNYFTLKPWMFDWFLQMFGAQVEQHRTSVGAMETDWFVPQKADKPINLLPANAAINLSTTGQSLKWDPGYFAHVYDIYFGVDPNPPLYKADLKLGSGRLRHTEDEEDAVAAGAAAGHDLLLVASSRRRWRA